MQFKERKQEAGAHPGNARQEYCWQQHRCNEERPRHPQPTPRPSREAPEHRGAKMQCALEQTQVQGLKCRQAEVLKAAIEAMRKQSGLAFPKIAIIAKRTNYGDRSFRRALQELEATGHLKRKRCWKVNQYKIHGLHDPKTGSRLFGCIVDWRTLQQRERFMQRKKRLTAYPEQINQPKTNALCGRQTQGESHQNGNGINTGQLTHAHHPHRRGIAP